MRQPNLFPLLLLPTTMALLQGAALIRGAMLIWGAVLILFKLHMVRRLFEGGVYLGCGV